MHPRVLLVPDTMMLVQKSQIWMLPCLSLYHEMKMKKITVHRFLQCDLSVAVCVELALLDQENHHQQSLCSDDDDDRLVSVTRKRRECRRSHFDQV